MAYELSVSNDYQIMKYYRKLVSTFGSHKSHLFKWFDDMSDKQLFKLKLSKINRHTSIAIIIPIDHLVNMCNYCIISRSTDRYSSNEYVVLYTL